MRKLFGYLIMFMLFASLFIAATISMGLADTLSVFALAASVIGLIYLAVYLIEAK